MSGFFYYLAVFTDSLLSIAGIRAPYEQPRYSVIGHIGDRVEIRAYDARVAAETQVRLSNDGEAFGHLFRYITGANQAHRKIAMTVPVETDGEDLMRLFLPRAVAGGGPPVPTDPLVHIVKLPAENFAVLRFSGTATDGSRREHEAALVGAVAGAGRKAEGVPLLFSYDPPFALPFVRRNEVAVILADGPAR